MAASSTAAGNRAAITLWTIPWTSDSSGNYSETFGPILGTVLRVITDPGAPATPNDNYDMTLSDPWGFDVLGGRGADRDWQTTESFTPLQSSSYDAGTTITPMPIAVYGNVTLSINGAGNAKSGTVYLIVG